MKHKRQCWKKASNIIMYLSIILFALILLASCNFARQVKSKRPPFQIVGKAGTRLLIQFFYWNPKASSVHIAGSFNKWNPPGHARSIKLFKERETGFWTVVIPLEPGSYLYKYIINETTWKPDPNNANYVWD